jgi:hypothetical protein
MRNRKESNLKCKSHDWKKQATTNDRVFVVIKIFVCIIPSVSRV